MDAASITDAPIQTATNLTPAEVAAWLRGSRTTQADLARRARVSPVRLSRYLSGGKVRMRPEELAALSTAMTTQAKPPAPKVKLPKPQASVDGAVAALADDAVKAAIVARAEELVGALLDLALHGESEPVRVRALDIAFSRGWGTPRKAEPPPKDTSAPSSDAELQRLLSKAAQPVPPPTSGPDTA